jgi:hypothetical protein
MSVQRMSKNPSFKDVLRGVIAGQDPAQMPQEIDGADAPWNKKLHNFLKRWLNDQANNERWGRIATDAERSGMAERREMSREECLSQIVTAAAWAMFAGYSESKRSRESFLSESAYFHDLASHAQILAAHYSREAERGREKKTKNSWAVLVRESIEQRAQLYGREVEALGWEAEKARMLASRAHHQSRGKIFTHEQLSFMRSLAGSLYLNFGEPHCGDVAAITNLAYRNELKRQANAEDVRQACKPVKSRDATWMMARYAASERI